MALWHLGEHGRHIEFLTVEKKRTEKLYVQTKLAKANNHLRPWVKVDTFTMQIHKHRLVHGTSRTPYEQNTTPGPNPPVNGSHKLALFRPVIDSR